MASNNQYRVTKDTSARKNTDPPRELSIHELAAIQAAPEAYVNSLTRGYTKQIEEIEAEHAEQMTKLEAAQEATNAELKAQLSTIQADARNSRYAGIAEGKKAVREETVAKLKRLANVNAALQAENDQADAAVKEALAGAREAEKTAQSQRARQQTQIVNLNTAHANAIAELQRKIDTSPKSWIEINFKHNRRKTKTYYRRLNATLRSAAAEVCADHNESYTQHTFRAGVETLDVSRTFEELGIGDRAVIWYGKH